MHIVHCPDPYRTQNVLALFLRYHVINTPRPFYVFQTDYRRANAENSERGPRETPSPWQLLENIYNSTPELHKVENGNMFTGDELFEQRYISADADNYLVPNLVHYVRFGSPNMSFVDMLSIKSAWLNIRPNKLYIHCDEPPSGRWWEEVRYLEGVELKKRVRPLTVFGKSIDVVQHASDVARLQILLEHGGIYLDNDVLVIRSFDKLRRYEFSVGWPHKQFLGNQILVASAHARFLELYYRTYRYFNDSAWYYNAGELPTKEILYRNPSLVHREQLKLGVHTSLLYFTFMKTINWRRFYCIHLFYRQFHEYMDDPMFDYNPDNIKNLNTTFGEMARWIYYGL